jgi:hypothetical protein
MLKCPVGIAFFFLGMTVLLAFYLELESEGVKICGGRFSVDTNLY